MDDLWNRRRVLKQLIAVAGTSMLPAKRLLAISSSRGTQRWEIQIASVQFAQSA